LGYLVFSVHKKSTIIYFINNQKPLVLLDTNMKIMPIPCYDCW